ncbi:MAG TPA: hypothetical protein VIT67_01950, partial [Povalibacter sp.]
VLHARYWNSLDQLDRFLQDMGIVAYTVDRTRFLRWLPAHAKDSSYFPAGPEEFLDHELIAYLRTFLGRLH